MGKIRTEGEGEVQEIVDIVSPFSHLGTHLTCYTVRLWCRFITDDEWTRCCIRKESTQHPRSRQPPRSRGRSHLVQLSRRASRMVSLGLQIPARAQHIFLVGTLPSHSSLAMPPCGTS